MKIIHTADWHIGQQFYEFDRASEHQAFLNWLVQELERQSADVLLISGDIFDHANPSAASVKMFYDFLKNATTLLPKLQIIVTAGNHDSAQRLESPLPLLASSRISIVGLIDKKEDRSVNFEKLRIPLLGKNDAIEAWCLAIPYIRLGDYPNNSDYNQSVQLLYQEAYQFHETQNVNNLAVIAMGHLHASKAEISDLDQGERPIIGNLEGISIQTFHENLKYVALGHIHKAQRIGGLNHIRYSGSPLPMSFSEKRYVHQIISFDLENGEISNLESVKIPVTVPLVSIPEKPSTLEIVLEELELLENKTSNFDEAPYLEVNILEEGPDPTRKHRIEKVIENKAVRLARINVVRPQKLADSARNLTVNFDLKTLKPKDILKSAYLRQYGAELPESLEILFEKVEEEVRTKEA